MGKILLDAVGDYDKAHNVLTQFAEMRDLNGKFQFIFEEIKNNLPKSKKSEVEV